MIMYRGDLKPDLVMACANNLEPVDLTTAETVKVNAILNGVPLFSREATSATAEGVATMEWEAGDTDDLGYLAVEVEVTWAGKPQTFRSPKMIEIVEDFG